MRLSCLEGDSNDSMAEGRIASQRIYMAGMKAYDLHGSRR
jgi:hypothetical protein